MNKRLLIVVALAALLAPLAAQKRPAPSRAGTPRPPAPASRVERVVPFRTGERLSYDISWSSFITATAATATVAVREKRAAYGSLAYYIVADGQPTPFLAAFYSLYYKADTWLDAYTLLPLRASLYSQERARRQNEVTTFDQARGKARFEAQGATTDAWDLKLPPQTHDPVSAIFAIRTLPMKAGAHTLMPLTLNGNLYQVRVTIDRKEMLATPMGTLAAWHVTPLMLADGKPVESPRGMTLWISDDARRLPLKMQVEMEVGTFNLTLRQVQGAASIAPAR